MKRYAIFGGTFDPVHLGHLKLAETAKDAVKLDRVIFVPCWKSPFKSRTVATGEQRLEMLNLAIEELEFQDWAEVSDYEINRPEPSYSWQTTEAFRDQFYADEESIEWHWIMGTDQWDQLEEWAEPEKLRELLEFIVVTRDGDEVTPKDDWKFQAINFDHPASATKIRENRNRYQDWLPESVVKYCEKNLIY